MLNQKGFTAILFFLGILILSAGIVGSSYYVKQSRPELISHIYPSPTNQGLTPIPVSSLSSQSNTPVTSPVLSPNPTSEPIFSPVVNPQEIDLKWDGTPDKPQTTYHVAVGTILNISYENGDDSGWDNNYDQSLFQRIGSAKLKALVPGITILHSLSKPANCPPLQMCSAYLHLVSYDIPIQIK